MDVTVGRTQSMKEVVGDLWKFHVSTNVVVITTNGMVKLDGRAVMGRGVAYQALRLFPDIPVKFGKKLTEKGNHVHYFMDEALVTFPVKHMWWDKADLDLISRSADELVELAGRLPGIDFFIPRPGCGNGNLSWDDVKPIIKKKLDNRFTIVYEGGHEF